MKKLLTVLVALFVSAQMCWAVTKTRSWNYASPGGGGDFTAVSVAPSGNVIVAGDVAGMWRRSGNSGYWTRIGRFDKPSGGGANDGLYEQTCVNSVAICPKHPTRVIAGTKSGIIYSEDSGAGWKQLSSDPTSDNAVTAVAWGDPDGADSLLVACAYNEGGQAKMITATWSSSGEPTFSGESNIAPADDGSNKYCPIKIVFDPATAGSNRDFYVLFGMANNLPSGANANNTRRDLYRRINNGSNDLVSATNVSNVIDIVMSRHARGDFYVATATAGNGPSDRNSRGQIVRVTTDFNNGNTLSAALQTLAASSDSLTGAMWLEPGSPSDSNKVCMYTVSRDVSCGSSKAGIWKKLVDGAFNSWALIDDGQGTRGELVSNNWVGTEAWENGWDNCTNARGQTQDNVAHSISEQGQYIVTSRHVYCYTTVVNHYPVLVGPPPTTTYRDSTATLTAYRDAASTKSGSDFSTKGIDNINPATISMDGNGAWVGYFDAGLWYGGGGSWQNKNVAHADWGWSGDGVGGNVNSIYSDGDILAVCEAPSSKTNSWQFWKKPAGGSWSISNPGAYSAGSTYLRSIARDNVSGRMWTTNNGRVWRSDNLAVSWTAADTGRSANNPNALPDSGGFYCVASHGQIVVVGGPRGIFTSSSNGNANTWNYVDVLGWITTDCPNFDDPYKENWGGIHDIWYDQYSGDWLAASFVPNKTGCTGAGLKKGVLVSTDNAQSWSAYSSNGGFAKGYYIRSVYADSCNGERLHFTSADQFPPGGPNDHTHIDAAEGSMTCRWSVDFDSLYCVNDITDADRTDPLWRYKFGGMVRGYQVDDAGASGNGSMVYVLSQGNGPMYYVAPSGMDGGTCAVEITGGGGEMRLRRPREEAQAAPLELRRMFSVQEAAALVREGKLELFDVSGRRAKAPTPGVYFSVKRDAAGAITTRRTVLVTR